MGTNERRWLEPCLATLLDSDIAGIDLTIWYVDNDSQDGSTAFIEDRFPQVRTIQNQSNVGFARANNIGMRAAVDDGADYVFLVNPDTRTPNSLVRELTEFMETWTDYGVVGPMQYEYDETDTALGAYNDWSKSALRWGERHAFAGDWPDHPSPASPPEGRAPATLEHAYVQGAAFFVRAALLRTVGLFDEVFHTYYEETDLCRRARWAGWRVALLLDVGIQHFGGGGTAGSSYRRIQMRRNRYYYLLTDIDWRPLPMLRLTSRWLKDDLRGRGVGGSTSWWRGTWETAEAMCWLVHRAPLIRARRRAHRRLGKQTGGYARPQARSVR
ncbi:glycosyltransferase family 2 protein [Streptomyces malaysiensis]|uniref:glycosyltransferase family 2 protein n=1 Tax=Streptomyces malaysiensis TaxID=92644 RepID=UPI002B2B8CA0|nr:glycosyltransferase family 2 protein [Streptomyces malaysiensis]